MFKMQTIIGISGSLMRKY